MIDLAHGVPGVLREPGALSPVQAQGRPRAFLCGQRGGAVPRAGPTPAPASRRLGADDAMNCRFFGVPNRVTVSRDGDRWFASIAVDTDDVQPMELPGDAVSVDLGVKTLAVLSSGESIPGPKAHRRLLGAIRRRSRALSRKRKGSANRRKAKARLARLHARSANIRRDATAQGDDAYRQGLAGASSSRTSTCAAWRPAVGWRARSWMAPSTSSAASWTTRQGCTARR